jgi:hypothetical protein
MGFFSHVLLDVIGVTRRETLHPKQLVATAIGFCVQLKKRKKTPKNGFSNVFRFGEGLQANRLWIQKMAPGSKLWRQRGHSWALGGFWIISTAQHMYALSSKPPQGSTGMPGSKNLIPCPAAAADEVWRLQHPPAMTCTIVQRQSAAAAHPSSLGFLANSAS